MFLAVDCGNCREGFPWDSDALVSAARRLLSAVDSVHLKGIYTHCGDSYQGEGVQGVKKAMDEGVHF